MKKSFVLSLSTCLIVLLSSSVFAYDKERKGKGHKHNKIGKMFDQTDVNQDGQLELSEFLAHAEERFKSMDLNEDGYVTKEEGRDAHRQMREKRKEMRKEKRKERQEQRESEESVTE